MHVNTKLTHVTLSYTWHLHANVVVTKTIVTCRGLAVKDCGELPYIYMYINIKTNKSYI